MRLLNTFLLTEGLSETIAEYGNPDYKDWYTTHVVTYTLPYTLTKQGEQIITLPVHAKAVDNLDNALTTIWTRTRNRVMRDLPDLTGTSLHDEIRARLRKRGLLEITDVVGTVQGFYLGFAYEKLTLPQDVSAIFEANGWIRATNGQFQRASAI